MLVKIRYNQVNEMKLGKYQVNRGNTRWKINQTKQNQIKVGISSSNQVKSTFDMEDNQKSQVNNNNSVSLKENHWKRI